MPINFDDIAKLKQRIADNKQKSTEDKSKFTANGGTFSVHTKTTAMHLEKAAIEIGYKGVQDLIAYAPTLDDAKANPLINLKNQGQLDEELAHEALRLKKLFSNVQLELQAKRANGNPLDVRATSSFKRFEAVAKQYNSVDWAAWIPTTFTSFTWEELEIPYGLAGMFPTFAMSSKTQEIPLRDGYYEGQLEGETGTFTPQTTDVDKVTVSSKNNVVHVQFWNDMLEDNIDPQLFDKQRLDTAMGIVRSFENAIINGDDSTVHMDADVTSAKDFRRAFKGLRKLALENSGNGAVVNGGGTTINLGQIQNLILAAMAESDTSNFRFIMPAIIWNSIRVGKIPEILTVQNAGSNATMITGNVFPLFGIDNYKAPKAKLNLNANGVNAASTDALTSILLADISRFVVGNRSGIRFWIGQHTPDQDKLYCTAKQRHTFGAPPQSEKERGVCMLRNLAKL